MENMDKGLTVPKWVLIVWPKIPKMPNYLSAQFVCPSPMKKASLGIRSPCGRLLVAVNQAKILQHMVRADYFFSPFFASLPSVKRPSLA
jgi:hypothetical protein